MQNELAKIYDIAGYRVVKSGFENGSINVLGKEIQSLSEILQEDVEKWYAAGTNSGFGNVMKQETQHNDHILVSQAPFDSIYGFAKNAR
jgi:hypothetical protein